MKLLIGIIVFILMMIGVVYLDAAIVDYIADEIPASAAEWMGIIRICLWVAVVLLTGGLTLGISIYVASIAYSIVNFYTSPARRNLKRIRKEYAKSMKS